ncbi:GNAT family N-acetyltransferase [Streptomyces sp. WMMC940]|uniref:GNAT family N-acetyltransferase n=1 Tax=Streptomyces sp. WMMC940 TaxID=3015153 RepID=UPI0022B72917|nr:GNAT family N-acetyltransferase [Streptomyces sp. WMMC940]MCZ7458169.1 GNAT family N-acetyltransferase [Streptomyces sp. WMMC940]
MTIEASAGPDGAESLYRETVEGLGTVHVRRLDPARDADVVHSWVSEERARFWGMRETSRDEVREIYEHLDSLTTHHAFLIVLGDEPVMLFQTYAPEADRVGECYEVEPGDIGVHLMIGPTQGSPRPGFTAAVLRVLVGHVLADEEVRRIVAEPDVRNARAIERLHRTGFELGPEIVLPEVDLPEVFLPEKKARLAFLRRETAETLR